MGAGYRMTARGNREAEVLIYEDVGEWFGGVTAKDFHADLRRIGGIDTLNVRLNSYGGEVFEGLAIYRHLAEHPARKVVHVDGVAASIASIIAMAGHEIRIAAAARMMVHEASGFAAGRPRRLREVADQLESMSGSLADVYVARTGRKIEEVRGWMDAATDTWFTAPEALAAGLATSIVENVRAAARYDPRIHGHIRNVPADILAAVSTARPARDTLAARIAAQRARLLPPV